MPKSIFTKEERHYYSPAVRIERFRRWWNKEFPPSCFQRCDIDDFNQATIDERLIEQQGSKAGMELILRRKGS